MVVIGLKVRSIILNDFFSLVDGFFQLRRIDADNLRIGFVVGLAGFGCRDDDFIAVDKLIGCYLILPLSPLLLLLPPVLPYRLQWFHLDWPCR